MKVRKILPVIGLSLSMVFSCSNYQLESELGSELVKASKAIDTSVLANYSAEDLSSSDVGTLKEGYINLGGGEISKISYVEVEGINIYQGDMVLHDDDIYETEESALKATGDSSRAIVDSSRLWANNTVGYYISPNVHSRAVITGAIAELEASTNLRFEERSYGNYVKFIPHASACYSQLGCVGGSQDLALADWATVSVAVHELQHAVGVYHEQCRKDRDNYLTINWENIDSNQAHNFRKASGYYAHDVGEFDWNSIMLYPSEAFSNNGKPTMVKKDGSTFGRNTGRMSSGDIAGLNFLYPGNTTDTQPPSVPAGLSASNITSSSVTLSWNASNDNIGVTGYEVYKNGLLTSTVSTTTAAISGLSKNTLYQFSVVAVDAAGNKSNQSIALSVTTLNGGTTPTTDWVATKIYVGGDEVTHNGLRYRAKWWTTGEEPGTTGEWGVWLLLN